MPNGTYGGVRGRKTKVGRKLLRFPPTRLPSVISLLHFLCNYAFFALFFIKIYCYIVILSIESVKIFVFYCCIAQSE